MKTITLVQPDWNQQPETHRTEIAGVLVFEVKSVAEETAEAVLRFDSPRVSLPDSWTFNGLVTAPQSDKERSKALARALEAALKSARWNVCLSSDGRVQIESRTPEHLRDWLKDMESAGTWRKKVLDALAQIVENDFGLQTHGTDDELLLRLGQSQPGAPTAAATGLRPLRGIPRLLSRDAHKVTFRFQREAPSGPAQPYAVPNLVSRGPDDATVRLAAVSASSGRAQFDLSDPRENSLLMLDLLEEEYTATLACAYGSEEVRQDVTVQYRLKRLKP